MFAAVGLAGAGFADDREGRAATQLEGHVVDGQEGVVALLGTTDVEFLGEAFDADDCFRGGRALAGTCEFLFGDRDALLVGGFDAGRGEGGRG